MRMRRSTAWTLGAVVQLLLLLVTRILDGPGTQTWHHLASLAGAIALMGLAGKRMQNRAFLGIGILLTTILATVSGFVLLYFKEGLRVDGHQDWLVFWHLVWSWFASGFFVMHVWVNRVAFVHFFQASFRSVRPGLVHGGAYVVSLLGLLWSATLGKSQFNNESYIPQSVWAWLLCTAVAYGIWLGTRRAGRQTHLHLRSAADLILVPVMTFVILSGFVLLYGSDVTDPNGLKYAAKAWHTLPSVLFSVVVFVHSVQLWTQVRRHWQRLGTA